MRARLFSVVLLLLALFLAGSGSVYAASAATQKTIVVAFSNDVKNPASVVRVNRVTTSDSVATVALQELIAGPNPEERANLHAFSELNGIFTGPPATVGGPDFTIQIANGVATVRFTRATASAGVMQDARIINEIKATLLQFPTIKSVTILTKDGNVFGSGKGDPQLHVDSVDIKVTPATLSTWTCGSYIQVVYTALFQVTPGSTGGVIDFAYSLNGGRTSTAEHLIILPGQKQTDYVFTWQGPLPADHTQPGAAMVKVTSPNDLLSAAVGPAGACRS